MSTSSPPPRPDPPPPDIEGFVRRVRRSSDRRAALLRPLSEADRDAVADRFLASVTGAQASPVQAPAAQAPAPVVPEGKVAKVTPLRRVRVAVAAAALALAAAATLVLPRVLVAPPGATWAVQGEQKSRSVDVAPEERVVVRPETTLRIAVTLDRPADEVKVRLLVRRGDSAGSVPAARRIQEGRTLGFEQRAEEMLGPQSDGPAELVLIGGGELPGEGDAIEVALGKKSVRGWVVLRRAIVLEGWQKAGLDLDVAGCASLLADGTCELGPERRLVVWGAGRPSIRIDGEPFGAAFTAVGRGTRQEVAVPAGAGELTVATGGHRVSFGLRARGTSAELEAAAAALREGRLDAAEVALAEGAPGSGDGERIAGMRIAAKIKRRRAVGGTGTIEEAQAARLAVAREADAAGRVSEAADDRLAVAFSYLIETHDVAGAKELLDASEASAARTAETRVLWEYYRGLWALETGDLGAALDDLERARDRALRVGLDGLAGSVAPSLAEALAQLGRSEDALSLLPAPAGGEGCALAVASSNRGWVRLLGGDVAGAAVELSAALVAAGGKCPAEQPALALNLSYAEEARGAPDEAVRWLLASRAATRPTDARLAEWQDRLEMRIALGADPSSALAAADRLTERGGEERSPEVRFEAALGRGRALVAAGRLDAASGVFRQAEDALDRWVLTARLGQGRETMATRLDTAPRTWLSFYADRAERAGGAERAREEARLCGATRRSLSRWIRTLSPSRREAESRAPDADGGDLCGPPPREGELLLLFHPLTTGVLGIARTSEQTRHVRISAAAAADPEAAAAALAGPFREEIRNAAGVRLLLHRSFAAWPWGAVAMPERSLSEVVALTYGLGLDPPEAPAAAAGPRRAIVVLDPRGDLVGARSSAAPAALAALGFEVTELRGAGATREAVRRALRPPCAELLHFEGHGAHRGVDGHDAGLSLFDGELTVRDIRALPCAPRHVVLAACDTARPSGFALSHAFVERGAAAVLGAKATIDDALAADVMRHLYSARSTAAAGFEPARALRLALVALRDRGGEVAAAAAGLRVVVP